MAALPLPAPGTKYGPCVDACAHHDCAESRRMANAPCVHCGRTIGYDVPFYALSTSSGEKSGQLAHETCHYIVMRGGSLERAHG